MQVDSATTTSAIIAALKQGPELDTSNWSCRCVLTLALKPKLCSGGYLFSLDEMQAKENFRVFMKSLNRACYGRAVRRHGLRLRPCAFIWPLSFLDTWNRSFFTICFKNAGQRRYGPPSRAWNSARCLSGYRRRGLRA
jgi:hypothetical protein